MKNQKPEIFRYHDYQAFLRDWLAFRKASQSGFSIRSLAKQAGLASGYLPMVLSGKRPLTAAALAKLAPFLGLSATEKSFFEDLLVLGTSDSHEARIQAVEQMKRFRQYRDLNPSDTETYEYLTHWYYIAIREMSALPGFRLDARWVQAHLRYPVPLKEVQAALEFLVKSGFIEMAADGSVRPPEKALDCNAGVHRLALGELHREIFSLAARAIDHVPREERSILGHAVALNADDLDRAKEIVDEAIRKIRELGTHEKKKSAVYHLEVALFPLTRSEGEESDE